MRGLVLVTTAVLFPLAVAVSAVACPRGADVVLTVHQGDSAHGRPEARATLTCLPPAGTHPHPLAACRALAAGRGDPARLRPRHGICPMIAAPVTVVARGHWFGRPVRYRRTFANRCLADRSTAGLFDF